MMWLYVSIAVLSFVPLLISYRKGIKSVSDHPGLRPLFSPMSKLGFALPALSFGLPFEWVVSMGYDFAWRNKYDIFSKFKSDVISVVPLLGGRPILYLADADLIQKINFDKKTFPKPVEEYTVLGYFGPNLVISEGHDWRRQQRIAIPAFSSASYALLWRETKDIVNDMMVTEQWAKRTECGGSIAVSHVVNITLRLALLAITRAGFGIDMKWAHDREFGDGANISLRGTEMSVQQALHIVAQESVLKLVVPDWMTYLPFRRLRVMRRAFSQLERHIKRLIGERKAEIYSVEVNEMPRESRNDLFSNLIYASMRDTEERGLSDEELIGNIYIFLLAGHETTAHTLAFTFAMLALYPDEQEALYQHIREVMPMGSESTIDDYKRFDRVRAVYLEVLRLFPPIQMIPKVVAEDTVLIIDETNELNVEIGKINPKYRSWKNGRKYDAVDLFTEAETPPLTRASSTTSFDTPLTPLDTESPLLSMAASVPNETAMLASFRNKKGHTSSSRVSAPVVLQNNGMDSDREGDSSEPNRKRLAVEKGTIVFIDPAAVHYNPKYYPDPKEFRPDRFMGDYNKAAFLPFSTGTRACIGRHFSEVESVCVLAHVLNDYSVHPVFQPGETHAELRERLSRASTRITLSPKEIPLVFKRREMA